MDVLHTPTIVTAAIFVALIFLDLFRRDYDLLPGHGFFGLLCVMLMAVICQHSSDLIGWGLLAVPAVVLVIGWGIQVTRVSTPVMPYPTISPAALEKSRRCSNCKARAYAHAL